VQGVSPKTVLWQRESEGCIRAVGVGMVREGDVYVGSQ
jgi:hypothetical protein